MLKRWLFTVMLGGLLVSAGANVVFQVKATNPSVEETHVFPVRSALPKGITREDVVDSADMAIVYDEKLEGFVAQKEVTLAPQETVVFDLLLRDIWQINPEELAAFKVRAEELVGKLEGEVYEPHGKILLARIRTNIGLITERQQQATVPEVSIPDHIGAFDRNSEALALVRGDLLELENLLAIISDEIIIKTGKPKGVPPNLATIWKVIFLIISFVAVMSVAFFLIWAVQLRKVRAAEKIESQKASS